LAHRVISRRRSNFTRFRSEADIQRAALTRNGGRARVHRIEYDELWAYVDPKRNPLIGRDANGIGRFRARASAAAIASMQMIFGPRGL
jgi:hypothetical protein